MLNITKYNCAIECNIVIIFFYESSCLGAYNLFLGHCFDDNIEKRNNITWVWLDIKFEILKYKM